MPFFGQFTSNFGAGRRLNVGIVLAPFFRLGGTGFNSVVYSLSRQSDNKIIVGGLFSSFQYTSNNRLVRLNSDGSQDTTFDVGTGFNNIVQRTFIQSDGKIIAGGTFTTFNGDTQNRIIRLNSDGSKDTSWDVGNGVSTSASSVFAIAQQSDGKTIIGGTFSAFDSTSVGRIARANTDGSIDTGFNVGTGFNNAIYSIKVQSDDKILVGGSFTTFNGSACPRLVRLNADGSLDTTFNTGGSGPTSSGTAIVYDVTLQGEKILVGGNFDSYNGSSQNNFIKLNADGTKDTSLDIGTGPNNLVYTIAVQKNNKILIAGTFNSINGTGRAGIARLNNDGSVDATFDPGTGTSNIRTMFVLPSGQIYFGGQNNTFNGSNTGFLARLNSDGSLSSATIAPAGQDDFATPGTFSWTAPAGVTSVSVVAVGGGGGGGPGTINGKGGGGGALAYLNNIPVIPGSSYTVVVGAGGSFNGNGGESYFIDSTMVRAGGGSSNNGGNGAGGVPVVNEISFGIGPLITNLGGAGGGLGGAAGTGRILDNDFRVDGGGGGGAGGYDGVGGDGAGHAIGELTISGEGSGGGGGGGGRARSTFNADYLGGNGGNVGLYGRGANGAAVAETTNNNGLDGGTGSSSPVNAGGGGGTGRNGNAGAVRIIYGYQRAYPDTYTTNV